MLDFPDWKCFTHEKNSCFWRSRWWACRSLLREFMSLIDREWRVSWCRTESRRRRESCFPPFVLGNVYYMAHKKCPEINTPGFFLVNLCIQIRQTLFFSMMSFVLLCVKVCNDFKGGLVQDWKTLLVKRKIKVTAGSRGMWKADKPCQSSWVDQWDVNRWQTLSG